MKKVSYIELPMLVVNLSHHLVRIGSMMMIGHLGELSLSGASVATSLTNVTGFSLVLGMASALETPCGQAYGAEQYNKLGIYTTGAIISLLMVCIPISILWLFVDKILIFIGQDPLISTGAAKYSIWLAAALFPFAILQALIRYLQTQSLILPMVLSSVFSCAYLLVINIQAEFGKLWSCSCNWFVLLVQRFTSWFVCEILFILRKDSSLFSAEEVLASIREFFPLAIPSACMVC